MKIVPKYKAPVKVKIPVQVWVDIPGYEGDYQISSLGRVKSFKGISDGRILKPGDNGKGYLYVNLSKSGKVKNITIHKLMQLAFHLGEGVVDHINGIRDDNRIENLRIGTSRENSSNRIEHRLGHLLGTTHRKRRSHLPTPWESRITFNKKKKHLGCFATAQEAHERYNLALSRINNGETDKNKI